MNNFTQLTQLNEYFQTSILVGLSFFIFFLVCLLYFLSKVSQIEKALYASFQQQKRIADSLEKQEVKDESSIGG